jgi:nucleotide-binding universal stress UspA family protein
MKILIPTDFSKYSEAVILCAINELKRIKDCEAILMHVIEFDPEMIDSFAGVTFEKARDELVSRAKEKLEELVERFKSAGIEARYIEPYIGDPVVEIVKKAEEEKVGLIFMGAKGKGFLKKVLIGSVSEGVVELSNVPVLIAKFKVEGGVCQTIEGSIFSKVLYAFDYSEQAEGLLHYLKRFPVDEVIALHVVEDGEMDIDFIEKVRNELNAKIVLKTGKPHKVILDVAKDFGVTLVALGSGKDNIGSVADYVIRRSDKAVLVYK